MSNKKKLQDGFASVIARMIFDLPNKKKGKSIRSVVFSIQDVVNLFPEFKEEYRGETGKLYRVGVPENHPIWERENK